MKISDIIKEKTEEWYILCTTACDTCNGEDIAHDLLGEKTKVNGCIYDAVVAEANSHLNTYFGKELFFPNLENEE